MTSRKNINIGLLGLGTVGSSLANLLKKMHGRIECLTASNVILKRAMVRDLNAQRDCSVEGIELVDSIDPLLSKDIDIIVELIGGIQPAEGYLQSALAQKKPVVTANKSLLAERGHLLLPQFKKAGVPIFYEASVAGAIPIIRLLKKSLAFENITQLTGVINGTTNFILDQIAHQNLSFDHALKKAQDLGFAEADASFDIGGIDAAHKLSILANLAFGIPLNFKKIWIQGIEHIGAIDLKTADHLGYTIKHVAKAFQSDLGLYLSVMPMLINKQHAFANVQGAMNAICLDSSAIGSSVYCAQGAGGMPTAAAVLSDIYEAIEYLKNDRKMTTSMLFDQPDQFDDVLDVLPRQSYCIFVGSEKNDNFQEFAKKLSSVLLKLGCDDSAIINQSDLLTHQSHHMAAFKTQTLMYQHLNEALKQLSSTYQIYNYFPIF